MKKYIVSIQKSDDLHLIEKMIIDIERMIKLELNLAVKWSVISIWAIFN